MPKRDRILNLPGFTLQKVTGKNPLVLHVRYRRVPRCPHCASKNLRKKDSFWRRVLHHTLARRQTYLAFKAHKFYCRHCRRYFNQTFPGILKYQRATEGLKEEIFRQHTQGIDQKALAEHFKVGSQTIERWYHQCYQQKRNHYANQRCPHVLGIDEHRFSKTQGYATTLCDLKRQRIYDITKGKSAAKLNHYLNQLQGKERVKVICMDLSSTYRSIAQHYFPNAKIVADRFHVIQLLNHMFLKTFHHIDPNLKYQRGLLAALRTKEQNLADKRRRVRDHYLNKNPVIATLYHFQVRLYRLLMKKTRTAKQCRRLIPLFLNTIQQLKKSPFQALAKLGRTFYLWRDEIVRMWRFSKNNGITEGFHRKMKLIQRRAYGFKNFENYRLRVRVLCC